MSDALMRPVIQGIQFIEGGEAILINYMIPAKDVRNRELLMMSHQLCVNRGDGGRDYGDEIDAVEDAALALLRDALEDWESPRTDVGIKIAQRPPDGADGADDDDE